MNKEIERMYDDMDEIKEKEGENTKKSVIEIIRRNCPHLLWNKKVQILFSCLFAFCYFLQLPLFIYLLIKWTKYWVPINNIVNRRMEEYHKV